MKMKNIEIYTRPGCGYCVHTKKLLTGEELNFVEHDIFVNPEKLTDMQKRTSNRTFPQIFIDDKSIGGFDELLALSKQEKLSRGAA